MSLHWTFCLLLVVLATVGTAENVTCTSSTACEPWDLQRGPYCARGNLMNLRFGIDIAPENEYYRYQQWNTEAAFAACVTVDELQALNLTFAARYVATVVPNTTTPAPITTAAPTAAATTDPTATSTTAAAPTTTAASTTTTGVQFSSGMTESWLSAFAFGGNDNIPFPNKTTSTGTVMVFKNDSATRQLCPNGQLPFVSFVVLSVTMENGHFKYTADQNQPVGVGFKDTCSNGVCQLDSEQPCVGTADRQNCATCFTPDEMYRTNIQVWMSYAGTDRVGRNLVSYSNNPLNFRAFAASSAFKQVTTSLDDLKSGKVNRNDPLEPSA